MPSGTIPPKSSKEVTASKSVIASNVPPPTKFNVSVVASKATLVFVPWNLGLSVSSLSVLTVIESRISTRERFTLAAVALNLPPSS